MSVTVIADLLKDTEEFFQRMPAAATQAARMALNDTARGPALKMARDEIYDQVNFPAGYLGNDRLFVSKLARNDDLEASITGRDRPTSLARFATRAQVGQRGVEVQVHRGNTKFMKKAFIVKLRAGRAMDGKQHNLGLAIRLAPGEELINRNFPSEVHATRLGPNVLLLYGPSVDQVFRSVSSDIQPQVLDAATTEFFRQFARLTNG